MDTQLREGIHWVGYIDWNVRDFHSYNTVRGATYNAYLIEDEKVALIDTVKAPYLEDLQKHVTARVPLERIDYIVCNHAEPDHSGSLPAMVKACGQATVLCSPKCKAILDSHYDTRDWSIQVVKTGETVSLGRRTLTFMETPMVHWPDSMFTYVPEERLLFSMDAFGQHYASSHRFDDEVALDVVMQEAKKYYANIVMLYGKQIAKVLKQAASLEIETIAPSHGVIWRRHIPVILSAYQDWVVCKPAAKVLILYDTMWESTAQMAAAIAEGASEPDVEVKLMAIRKSSDTDIVTEVLDAACVAAGSATLNQTLMPAAAATLTYLKGLRPCGKAGFAFGSHGWGKGGPEAVQEYLEAMRFDILREPLKAKWRPDEKVLTECRAAGAMLAQTARERVNS